MHGSPSVHYFLSADSVEKIQQTEEKEEEIYIKCLVVLIIAQQISHLDTLEYLYLYAYITYNTNNTFVQFEHKLVNVCIPLVNVCIPLANTHIKMLGFMCTAQIHTHT